MRSHAELFERVRKRPRMFLFGESYEAVVGFVLGYDSACEGGSLEGFREWLVVRLDGGANLGWPALVLGVAFPHAKGNVADELLRGEDKQRHAINTMFQLIAEFDQVRAQFEGLRKVFQAFEAWSQAQEEKE